MEAMSQKTSRDRIIWPVVALFAAIIVLAANAHLAYVAIQTQPACVPHAKDKGAGPGQYQAAKSDC